MIYFVNQFHLETSKKIASFNESTEGTQINETELWAHTVQEMQEDYNLPAIHHTGDGYSQGAASEDELLELATELNIELDSEDDDMFQPIFTHLDEAYVNMYENNLNALMNQ